VRADVSMEAVAVRWAVDQGVIPVVEVPWQQLDCQTAAASAHAHANTADGSTPADASAAAASAISSAMARSMLSTFGWLYGRPAAAVGAGIEGAAPEGVVEGSSALPVEGEAAAPAAAVPKRTAGLPPQPRRIDAAVWAASSFMTAQDSAELMGVPVMVE